MRGQSMDIEVDFSKQTDDELEHSYHAIDWLQYPQVLRRCRTELRAREEKGAFHPTSSLPYPQWLARYKWLLFSLLIGNAAYRGYQLWQAPIDPVTMFKLMPQSPGLALAPFLLLFSIAAAIQALRSTNARFAYLVLLTFAPIAFFVRPTENNLGMYSGASVFVHFDVFYFNVVALVMIAMATRILASTVRARRAVRRPSYA